MAIEALVTALCVGGYNCETAIKAYYEQTPKVKEKFKDYKKDVTSNQLGKAVAYSVPALATLFTNNTAHIRLSKKVSAKVSEDSAMLLYGFTF